MDFDFYDDFCYTSTVKYCCYVFFKVVKIDTCN